MPSPGGHADSTRLLTLLDEARDEALLYRAWHALHSPGNWSGAADFPRWAAWSETSVALWREFLERNSGDITVAHHVAVACSARAWSLESAGSPEAAAWWTSSLDAWGRLSHSKPFLARLAAAANDPAVSAMPPFAPDPDWLVDFALEGPTRFVALALTGRQPDRAQRLVTAVRQSRLPLRIRRNFAGRCFARCFSYLPDLVAQEAFSAIRESLVTFLAVFPTCESALRTLLDVSTSEIERLSYQRDFDRIESLAAGLLPPARRYAGLEDATPLGQRFLVALADAVSDRYADFVHAQIDAREGALREPDTRARARRALDVALRWLELGCGVEPRPPSLDRRHDRLRFLGALVLLLDGRAAAGIRGSSAPTPLARRLFLDALAHLDAIRSPEQKTESQELREAIVQELAQIDFGA